MGLTQRLNAEWLSQNTQRKYPLAIIASGKDVTGDFTLPNDLIVGLYLSFPSAMNVNQAGFTIRTVQSFATGLAITIGYGNDAVPVAAVSIAKATHKLYQSYPMRGLGNFSDARGNIVIGPLDNLDLQPHGEWQFNLAGGRLEVDTIRPQIRGVTGIRVQNGTDLSDPITGDIVLRAGRNMRITTVLESGQDPIVQFDAIEGAGLNEDCICEGDIETALPIRTINRIGPDANGAFTLIGSACLDLREIANGLQMHDTCAQPCCGCKELEVVTQALEQFGQQATTMENFVAVLTAKVEQMAQVTLGAKLGDSGCF